MFNSILTLFNDTVIFQPYRPVPNRQHPPTAATAHWPTDTMPHFVRANPQIAYGD